MPEYNQILYRQYVIMCVNIYANNNFAVYQANADSNLIEKKREHFIDGWVSCKFNFRILLKNFLKLSTLQDFIENRKTIFLNEWKINFSVDICANLHKSLI